MSRIGWTFEQQEKSDQISRELLRQYMARGVTYRELAERHGMSIDGHK